MRRSPNMPYIAQCDQSGTIHILRSTIHTGSIALAIGTSRKALSTAFEVIARHAHTPGVLLVPGVPEAPTPLEGLCALDTFMQWAASRTPTPNVTHFPTLEAAMAYEFALLKARGTKP